MRNQHQIQCANCGQVISVDSVNAPFCVECHEILFGEDEPFIDEPHVPILPNRMSDLFD